ncbi:hypothetical protein FISHEDRAFT_71757 [Fistulina hepatica ATCC 64428]|uniref:Uncharacterized protein n=1 Tax=Fistulina hepatica ATCC 64428 TaxID=1128425 RepID=A0A0D7AG55_9AGAR|nr:hypothetical protein FISHEDRAFT_71757 [Fistulina hepatica ATCC 64428]
MFFRLATIMLTFVVACVLAVPPGERERAVFSAASSLASAAATDSYSAVSAVDSATATVLASSTAAASVFTAERVYLTAVDYSPYQIAVTTTITWTQPLQQLPQRPPRSGWSARRRATFDPAGAGLFFADLF